MIIISNEKMAKEIGKYLKPFIGRIDEYYDWAFDTERAREITGVEFDKNMSWYKKTRKLKESLINRFEEQISNQELEQLATYYIKEWGGIATYRHARQDIEEYKDLKELNDLPGCHDNEFKFYRIASWSKYLSLICPRWACIYDSRAAYAINVINYLAGDYDIYFPMPSGRSSKLNLIDIETLFLEQLIIEGYVEQGDVKHRQYAARVRKRFHINKGNVYMAYVTLINSVANYLDLDKKDHHKIEMLLFALAPTRILSDLIERLKSGKVLSTS